MELGRHKPSDRQAAGVFLLREGAEFCQIISRTFGEQRRCSSLSKENAAVFTAVRQPGGGLQRA